MKEKPLSELLEFSIINVDKPSGPTSFVACDRARRIIGAKKAGHLGTLDPKVTGVLPICLNRACRLSNFLMKKDKEYVGKMWLHSDISYEELKKRMLELTGKIKQTPPRKSSVKRVERERTVNTFTILKKEGKSVEFHSDVEAGTYIRKLISDLGDKIGGAHMTELRRVRAGIFLEKESHTINYIGEAVKRYKEGDESELRKILIPAEDIIKKLFLCINTKEESIKPLLNGKPLSKSDLEKDKKITDEIFAVFNKERFIGIYKIFNDKDFIAKPEFILN